MKDFFMEYGTFVLAIVGIGLMLWAISYIPPWLHEFVQAYVTGITGVPSTLQ